MTPNTALMDIKDPSPRTVVRQIDSYKFVLVYRFWVLYLKLGSRSIADLCCISNLGSVFYSIMANK